MKCPKCSAEFPLTWRRYFTAPLGRFPCPVCGTALQGKHLWWYWPLMLLGCLALGVPLACIIALRFGLRAGVIGWAAGAMISGFPVDKFLESRFTILQIRQDANSE